MEGDVKSRTSAQSCTKSDSIFFILNASERLLNTSLKSVLIVKNFAYIPKVWLFDQRLHSTSSWVRTVGIMAMMAQPVTPGHAKASPHAEIVIILFFVIVFAHTWPQTVSNRLSWMKELPTHPTKQRPSH